MMTLIHYIECDGCKKKMDEGCGNLFTLIDKHCIGCGGEEHKHPKKDKDFQCSDRSNKFFAVD